MFRAALLKARHPSVVVRVGSARESVTTEQSVSARPSDQRVGIRSSSKPICAPSVNVDLASTIGGSTGDGAIDTIIVNGTAAPDYINLNVDSGAVEVSGLAALVRITHPEMVNDDLIVNGLGGTDTITTDAGVTNLIGVTINQ